MWNMTAFRAQQRSPSSEGYCLFCFIIHTQEGGMVQAS